MLEGYLKEIKINFEKGDTTEPSFYEVLKNLLIKYSEKFLNYKTNIRILPKKTEGGNPDIKISKEKDEIIGYIEVKDLKIENLDKIEESEQLIRYRETFPNLILTNLFEFRLYREGKLVDKVEIGRPFDIFELKTIYVSEKIKENFYKLLDKFFSYTLQTSLTPENLAKILAKKTKFLKEIVLDELNKGEKFLKDLYELIKTHLIFDLNEDDFCDLYSQTITYGLFSARLRSINNFNRKEAYEIIPKNFGILRDIFKIISLEDIPENMIWIIDDITNLLSKVNVNEIFENYLKEKKGDDPVIYFYETFLAEYDPKEREKRGVYYTPDPVVSFIIRSINIILKEKFNLSDGLGDKRVTLLDPAGGTLTFLEEAIKLAIEEFQQKYGKGAIKDFIKEHILKNFYAFELMMAPYVIGHLRLTYLLKELGYELGKDERIKYYLTNTLEMEEIKGDFPFLSSISEESRKAGEVKKYVPILVIVGNPPYSGISANKSKWILDMIKEYYQIEGEKLKEKNPKWLQDDYVKFIRFAQDKIERNGEGVIGFITNHSYLDNPTFRGMRYSLLKTFDEIYILNLHGNALKKEVCPDGSKDENVFDIRQGVAISIFIKYKNFKGEKKVYYSDLWGLREDKYKFLNENDIKTCEFQEIKPKEEFFFFVPREEKEIEYNKFFSINEIFNIYSVGIVTSRDDFVIDFNFNNLKNRIILFKNSNLSDDELHDYFKINKKSGWNIREAWKSLSRIPDSEIINYILPILYRPFDIRWIFYHDNFIERVRKEVMQHMMRENLGLLVKRQNKIEPFSYSFITELITESSVFESAYANNSLFPLYLYPSLDKNHMFEKEYEVKEKVPNIKNEIFEMLKNEYKRDVSPEEILYYIYGVLYSNVYREKYKEFLKVDFPRVPFTKNYEVFKKIGELCKELIELHLLRSDKLNNPITKFEVEGNNLVKFVKYDENEKRVYINETQYFGNIEKDVYEYMIGGYQVLNKWLKDRKGRYLSFDEIITYTKIVTSLKHTIDLQKEIDFIYPDVENNLIV